jgi:uncharacterized protein YxeA
MKKMIMLVTAMAFLASGSLALARDVNRDSLSAQWQLAQAEKKKQDEQFKALDSAAKSKDEKKSGN